MSQGYRRFITFVASVIVLMLFLGGIITGAWAQEPDRCATIIPTNQHTPYVHFQRLSVDDGLSVTSVGHYLWLSNTANEPSIDHSVISIDLNTLPEGQVTVCVGDTSYTEVEQPTIEHTVDEPTEQEWIVPTDEPRVLRVWVPL